MANNMNISQPQIPMFKGENFGFWSIKMKTLFLSQDLWDFVENGQMLKHLLAELKTRERN